MDLTSVGGQFQKGPAFTTREKHDILWLNIKLTWDSGVWIEYSNTVHFQGHWIRKCMVAEKQYQNTSNALLATVNGMVPKYTHFQVFGVALPPTRPLAWFPEVRDGFVFTPYQVNDHIKLWSMHWPNGQAWKGFNSETTWDVSISRLARITIC